MDRTRRQYSSGSVALPYSVTQRNPNERTDPLKDISNLSERFESSFCVSKKPESKSLDVPASEKYQYQSSVFKESGQEISSKQLSWKEKQPSSRRVQTPESTKVVSNEPSLDTNKSVNRKKDDKRHNQGRYSRTISRRGGKTDQTPSRLSRDTKSSPFGCHSDVNDSFLPQNANPSPNQASPGSYTERSPLNQKIRTRKDTGRLQSSVSPLDQNKPCKNTWTDSQKMKSEQWQIPPPNLRTEDRSYGSGATYLNPQIPPIATNATPVQYKQGSSYYNPLHPIKTNATPVKYQKGSSYCNLMPSIQTNANPVQYNLGSSYCNPTPPIKTNATPVQYKQGSSYCNPMPTIKTNAAPVQYKQGSRCYDSVPPIKTHATSVQYQLGSSYCNSESYLGNNATPLRYNQGPVNYRNANTIRHVQPSKCYQNPSFPVEEQVKPLLTISSNAYKGFNRFPDVIPGKQVLKTDQDLTPPQKDIVPSMKDLKTDKNLKLPVLQSQKDIKPGMQDFETVRDVKAPLLQLPKDIVPFRQDLKTDEDLKPIASQLDKYIVQDRKDLETHYDLKSPALQPKKDIVPGKKYLETDKDLKPPTLENQKDILQKQRDLKTNQDLESPALQPPKDIVPGWQNLKPDKDLKPSVQQPQEETAPGKKDLKQSAQQPQEDIVPGRRDLKTAEDLKPPAQQPQENIVPGKQDLNTDHDLNLSALQPQEDLIRNKQNLKADQDLKPLAQQPQEDIVPGKQDLNSDQDLKPPALQQEFTTKGADNCNTLSPKRGISVMKKLQAFSERAVNSKKSMLKIDIPKTPPGTSYFPIHATSHRGLFIGRVQTNVIQFPPPSRSGHFGSSFAAGKRIVSLLPYQTVRFCTQTQVCSNFNPTATYQAFSRPTIQNNMHVHSLLYEVNPMHSSTQGQSMPSRLAQDQSAKQNLTPALPYQDLNNPIYPYGTQYPAIQNIPAESQYQDPNHPMYQYQTQNQPTHMQSTDSEYQDLCNPIYQYGMQYPPNTATNFQYQDPNNPIYQYGEQYQPMHMQSTDSPYQDPNYPLYQYGMEYQPMQMQSADSPYQDPNFSMHQYGMEYQPTHMQSVNLQYHDPNLFMYQPGTQYGPPFQDVNAEFQYQDPNLSMHQYEANTASETFEPPHIPWSYPTCAANMPSQQHSPDMLPMQTYETNPTSTSTIQYPTWPNRSADQGYRMTDYLNLLPIFSGKQTSVENPSSINVTEYTSGFQGAKEFAVKTDQATNHFQGSMSMQHPEVMNTNTYTRWSDETSDSHAK